MCSSLERSRVKRTFNSDVLAGCRHWTLVIVSLWRVCAQTGLRACAASASTTPLQSLRAAARAPELPPPPRGQHPCQSATPVYPTTESFRTASAPAGRTSTLRVTLASVAPVLPRLHERTRFPTGTVDWLEPCVVQTLSGLVTALMRNLPDLVTIV